MVRKSIYFRTLSLLSLMLWMCHLNLYGQTGPGGVGNSATNVLWLRSEDISSLTDGDDIALWADFSSNGNDVSQPVASYTPIFKTNIRNGFPAVRFNKTNGRLRRTNFSEFPTTQITAIYVNSNTEGTDGILSYASSSSTNDFLLFDSNNLRYQKGFYSILNSGISVNDGNFHIVNISRNETSGNVEIWKDGSRDYTGTIAPGSFIASGGSFAIAGEQDLIDGGYDAGQTHFGDFTEVIIFNTVLNQAQNIIISNYLSSKYGISISNDYYAYDAVHSNDVSGIGIEDASNIHAAAMSDNILQIENASEMDVSQEYLLFGHDNGDVANSWTTAEAPNSGVNIERLSREWRLDETGDVGTIDFVVDVGAFPDLPTGFNMYALMIDNDGDFSSEASVYEMTLVSGTRYKVEGIDFVDGDYVAIAAVRPTIEHTLTAGSGAENVDATLEISVNFIPSSNRTVEYTTTDMSAIGGDDYTVANELIATILVGNTSATYTIPITDDSDPESSETFISTLSDPSAGLNLGTNTIFTYSISDNDIIRKVYFDLEADNNNESSSPVTVNLSIDIADPLNPTSVDYAVSSGTAINGGTDYTLNSGTVVFPANTTMSSFTFTVNDDALNESNETFTVSLGNPVNCNLDNTAPFAGTGFTTYTYTINDNDANPEIEFSTLSSSQLESVPTFNIQVSLSETSGIDVSVNYEVTGIGTATSGSDYTLANGTITVPAGNTNANITALINNDSEVELDETILVTLSAPVNATLGNNNIFEYTILNDDNFGNIGPGGVGNNETNIVWLDASKISGFSDGEDITLWHDVSGNSNDFSEINTFSPTYKTNAVNGFPVVNFNKTNNRIRNPNISNFPSTEITAIFVNRNDVETTDDAHLSYASSANSNDFLLIESSNLRIQRGPFNANANSNIALNDGSFHIINTSWRSIDGNVGFWKDGFKSRLIGNFQTGVSLTAGGSLAIAGEQDAIDGGYQASQAHHGEYAEVILYNAYLNDAQQIIVSNYLSAKYDVSISNDFYVQDDNINGDFDFDVTGIGRASDGSFHFDSKGNGIIRMYNPSSLDNNDYLFWGRNNTTDYAFETNISNYKERISSIWRISKQNDVGTITFEIDLTGIDISGKQSCADFMLVVDNDNDLLSPTSSYKLTNVDGNIYQVTGVSFSDGDYFSIEYQDKIALDGTRFYNGSGVSEMPSIMDDCYKLLVLSTADGTIPLIDSASLREIEVQGGGNLVVSTGVELRVAHDINNEGEIRMIGTSQLVQTHAGISQVSGIGNLYIDQEGVATTVYQSGYWSSPVTANGNTFTISGVLKDGTVPTSATSNPPDINFTSADILDGAKTSPITISGRWLAKLVNDLDFTRFIDPVSENFNPPEAWNMKSTGGGTQNFTFKGIINDGDYVTSIDENRFTLLGNPYPSAVDADQFILDNSSAINGALYFYDATNDDSHNQGDYNGGYATRVNGLGTPFSGGTVPGKYIPVGQGFFVFRSDAGSDSIKFHNSQRSFQTRGGGSSFFSRNSEESVLQIIRLGFEFELANNEIYKRQLAIAFRGLTLNYEDGFDAEMFDRQPSDLALKLADRSEPFVISSIDFLNESMRLPLEMYLDIGREVTIKLDAIQNLSATVYLEDAVTGIYYNLNEVPAVLNLEAGNYTDRFFITFMNQSILSDMGNFSKLRDVHVFYMSNTKQIKILRKDNGQLKLNNVKVYNILGQNIMYNLVDNSFSDEFIINVSHLKSGIYIAKLETDKYEISKKIIIH